MKRTLIKLEQNSQMLEELQKELKTTETLEYYEIYGSKGEKQNDLQTIKEKIKDYLTKRYSLLESLQLELEKEKCAVSEMERQNLITA